MKERAREKNASVRGVRGEKDKERNATLQIDKKFTVRRVRRTMKEINRKGEPGPRHVPHTSGLSTDTNVRFTDTNFRFIGTDFRFIGYKPCIALAHQLSYNTYKPRHLSTQNL
jgi:hypothetical protein